MENVRENMGKAVRKAQAKAQAQLSKFSRHSKTRGEKGDGTDIQRGIFSKRDKLKNKKSGGLSSTGRSTEDGRYQHISADLSEAVLNNSIDYERPTNIQDGEFGDINQDSKIARQMRQVRESISKNPKVLKLVERHEKVMQSQRNLADFWKPRQRIPDEIIRKNAFGSDTVYKMGILTKAGQNVAAPWKSRFFVVRSRMIFYFKSKQAFEEGENPKGWIHFRHINPNKKGHICNPTVAHVWRGKISAFNLITDSRTYVFCAKNLEERMTWMRVLDKAYTEFWQRYDLPVPVNSKISNPEKGTYSIVDLKKYILKLEDADDEEALNMEEITRQFMLRTCFLRWKAAVKLQRLEKGEHDIRKKAEHA